MANVFNEAADGRGAWFKGYEVESIDRLDRLDSGLFTAVSAGEMIGRAGARMAVISTNSAGSARLMHHRIDRHDHLNLCPHSIQTSSPEPMVREIAARFPPPEEKQIPDFEGVTYATDVFLDYLIPHGLPALTFLWYGEPDNTFHMTGIGSPENKAALKQTDAQLGRVIDWWQSRGRFEGVQLMVVSDHGHLTIKEKVSTADRLRECGFRLAPALADGAQAAILEGLSTNLLVRDGDPDLAAEIAAALMEPTGWALCSTTRPFWAKTLSPEPCPWIWFWPTIAGHPIWPGRSGPTIRSTSSVTPAGVITTSTSPWAAACTADSTRPRCAACWSPAGIIFKPGKT